MSPLSTALLGVALGVLFGLAGAFLVRFPSRRLQGGATGEAALDAFQTCLILLDGDRSQLIGGDGALQVITAALNTAAPVASSALEALARLAPDCEDRLRLLRSDGEPFGLDVRTPSGTLRVEGRTSGALAIVRLSLMSTGDTLGPTAETFAAFVDGRPEPAWMADSAGSPVWVNRAWLSAVGARTLESAREQGVSPDREVDRVVRETATTREARTALRWMRSGGDRQALRVRAIPLEGGLVGVWSDDVTDAENTAERLGGRQAALESMLEQIADAIAIFGPDRRLSFHNGAFAKLWDLEPAWLADGPSHGELLDRLRQRGKLPEQGDYARFKAGELARHEQLEPLSEVIWRLPDERNLKVVGQPDPRGGLLMVFSDVTPELRLRSQFNHLLQVQQATLDKLSDAVAVFGADGRLRLHNEAFEGFWSATGGQLGPGAEFDTVVELCLRRLHDLQFWRDLKGRITDPDPVARAPMQVEILTADRRIVAHQSRPLPDGATLISFADITDTRQLERALADREAALSETERLKREFVGSVSYELRTPLTTIIGYAELLEHEGRELDPRARSHLASIRTAASQLARSINNVLDMAQFDAGDMAPEVEDTDVALLLASAADRWSRIAAEQGISLIVTSGEALGLMRADSSRLGEVLDHLTENALRHTPPGGKVTLSAERALGEVRLQVSDTGRGIPFHVQAHIFDRFSSQDRASSGLGLALVKALVELHGGWVALESEPGSGATFTCHLPETTEPSEARPELF